MDNELVKYFIEETNRKYEKLEEKVDQLLQFKWKIIGGSVIMSVVFTIVIQATALYFNH
jgi:hypothetical protein